MDVVEAIDAWIDEQIDDLSDEELENILEILDVVAASRFADLSISMIFDDDIDDLVSMIGGSADHRVYVESVLVDALYDDADGADAGTHEDDQLDDSETGDTLETDAPDVDQPDSVALGTATIDDLLPLDELAPHVDELGENETAEANASDVEPDDSELDFSGIIDNSVFLSELTMAQEAHPDDLDATVTDTTDADADADAAADAAAAAADTDTDTTDADADADAADTDTDTTDADATVQLVPLLFESAAPEAELRPFDDLGPAFLPESSRPLPDRVKPRSHGIRRILLPAVMIACLAAFAYGMVQLLDSLNSPDQQVASTDPAATPTPEPAPTARPTAVPATAAPLDPSAPTPTPTPEPLPPPRAAIRLINGDVMLATWPEVGAMPDISSLYDASADDLSPARSIAWLGAGLGVIDNDGNVLVVDPDARQPTPTMIYEVGGGIEAAVQIAATGQNVAVRTTAGDIILTPSGERADPDVLSIVWDAEEEGAAAVDISAVGDLVPFVLEGGDARMIMTGADNSVITIWLTGDQPPAFNVSASNKGILLGIGQGAVARYRLGDVEGDRLESVWDPFSTDEEPAIGYSNAGNRTAIVLGDGAIVLADDTGTGARVWDPAETEIRAFSALGNSTQVIVLLETGSVVRIPLDPSELIESVWDITDETLNPANQVAVEPADD